MATVCPVSVQVLITDTKLKLLFPRQSQVLLNHIQRRGQERARRHWRPVKWYVQCVIRPVHLITRSNPLVRGIRILSGHIGIVIPTRKYLQGDRWLSTKSTRLRGSSVSPETALNSQMILVL